MENAENLQELSGEQMNDNPEGVQQEAESKEISNEPAVEETASQPEQQDAEETKEEVVAEADVADDVELSHVDDMEEHDQDEWEDEDLDFSEATKEELLAKVQEISGEGNMRRVDRVLKAIKPRYDELYESEKAEALAKFQEGEENDPDDFEYHGDESDKTFFVLYKQLRFKRNTYYRDLESQKEENLKKKEHILSQIRELIDGEESNASFNAIKQLQEDWKKVGPVPGAHNKTLWANYNALLDRFYDKRSIYFELKDLDRKKNLKIKEELCEKAEALVDEKDMQTAILQLNELHEEYKKAGAVPKEDQETLWQRFKTASDAVYARRKDYFDKLKEELQVNLEKKLALAADAEQYVNFSSDQISEWNSKTKEIQDLQVKWEAIGGLPREKAKSVNKQFWGAFKTFFNHKNQFFKQLESMREENVKLKEDLIAQAETIKDNEDFDATAQKMKDLQAQWKNIGPVPEKIRNEIYDRFKKACDHFFDRKRQQNQEQNQEFEENLTLKLQICDQMEALAAGEVLNLDDVYDLVDNYSEVGFVPRGAMKKSQSRWDEATQKILKHGSLDDGDRMDLKNHIQMSRLRNSPGGDRKMQRKENSIKRKISALENDINTWKTNMEFFASSATADKLKQELQGRIDEAQRDLDGLRSQLDAIN